MSHSEWAHYLKLHVRMPAKVGVGHEDRWLVGEVGPFDGAPHDRGRVHLALYTLVKPLEQYRKVGQQTSQIDLGNLPLRHYLQHVVVALLTAHF